MSDVRYFMETLRDVPEDNKLEYSKFLSIQCNADNNEILNIYINNSSLLKDRFKGRSLNDDDWIIMGVITEAFLLGKIYKGELNE